MDEPPLSSRRPCPIVVAPMGHRSGDAPDRGYRRISGVDIAAQRSADTSNIQQLEASLQEKSTKLAGLHREVGDQAKALAELRNEIQQRMNEAAEAKEQLAQREAELEETRVQLSQRAGARTGGTPQDELATLLRIPNVKAVSLTGSDMAKRAAGFLLYDSQNPKSLALFREPAGMSRWHDLSAVGHSRQTHEHRDLSHGSRRNRSPIGQEGTELHGGKDLCRQP